MSGSVRMRVGPAVTRLRSYMVECQQIMDLNERTAAEVDQLRISLVKIQRTLAQVDGYDNEWMNIIQQLGGDAADAEEEIHANFKQDEKHFLEWADDARGIILDIEIFLADQSEGGSTHSRHSHRGGENIRELRTGNWGLGPNPHTVVHGDPDDAELLTGRDGRRADAPTTGPARAATGRGAATTHLPPARMPEFHGDALAWPEFWQAFERTVDGLNIDNGLKAHYLLTCMRGKAKRAVAGYRAVSEHYELIKKALVKQFGNEGAIRDAFHADLINLPYANESVASLRFYLQEVQRICRCLVAMGQTEDEPVIMMAIKSKLPRAIVLELLQMEKREKDEKKKWNMEKLRDGLEQIVSLREEAARCTQTMTTRSNQPQRPQWNGQRGQGSQQDHNDSARVFAVQTGKTYKDGGRKSQVICYFCQGSHLAGNCEKVKGVKERMRKLSELGRCLLCLQIGHAKNTCPTKMACKICKGDHNRIICWRDGQKYQQGSSGNGRQYNSTPATGANVLALTGGRPDHVLLMKADLRAAASTNSKWAKAIGLFDCASTVNFVSEEMARELGLKRVGKGDLDIYPFMAKEPIKMNAPRYLVHILLQEGGTEELIAYRISKDRMPSINGIDKRTNLISCEGIVPDLLIGMPHFWRFFRGLSPITDSLFEVNTSVGPIACGELNPGMRMAPKKGFGVVAAIVGKEAANEEEVAKFWSLETIGVRDDPGSVDDQVAMDLFQQSVHRGADGRFIVKWPWKAEKSELPSNFSLAYRRFVTLFEKLKKEPVLMAEYARIIKEDIDRGIVEVATRREGTSEHFLAHHPVVSPKKVRIVFDASARMRGGKSLNECLFRGPVIMPDLAGLLIRFRIPRIAMWADIEKAFHALELEEDEREVVKFIWVKDVNAPISAENLQYLRFVRVPFGVVSSPFLLSASVQKLLEAVGTPLAHEAIRNSYVDNVLIGCQSSEEAWQAYGKLKEIFGQANMNLREFVSNDLGLNAKFPLADRLDKERPKVLGIPWDLASDVIRMEFPVVEMAGKLTRRVVLKQLASNFDPLGLIVPALLAAKVFFQKLWESERNWDDRLAEEECEEWRSIVEAWKIPPIDLERRIFREGPCELHVFSDASKFAYATCVYLKIDGKVSLLYARSRLKPRKMPLSIPRMELLGVLIATRALKFIEKQLGFVVGRKFVWCDSKPVLHWVASREHQERFVENRLREIRQSVGVKFGYVPTETNPADLASRGCDAAELAAAVFWWEGPDWLKGLEEEWPSDLNFEIGPDEGEEDEDGQIAKIFQVRVDEPSDVPINFAKWNDWRKLVRGTAAAFKIARIWLKKIGKSPRYLLSDNEPEKANLSLYESAESWLMSMAQIGWENCVKKRNIKAKVGGDGLVRLETRIDNSETPVGCRQPIFFPKDSGIVRLLLAEEHNQLKHAGVETTLVGFLSKFWTPCARREAKKLVKSCLKCRRMQCVSFALPEMPILPKERVRISKPFEFVGVDYLGPSEYRVDDKRVKFWVALFTCLTTRAVDLEIVFELSAAAFLHVLRRFAARRGVPTQILSDNGTQFRAVAEVIEAELVGKWTEGKGGRQVRNFLIERRIKWRFIPALSPWQGGVYERLVKLIKDAFKRSLGSRLLALEELRTFIVEVEAALNSRPLTYVSGEAAEAVALRPIDFISPKMELGLKVPGENDEIGDDDFRLGRISTSASLREKWRSVNLVLDRFWGRWMTEYLPLLREKSKWSHRRYGRSILAREPKVGEVVLVESEGRPKNTWPLARITELDGNPCRSVKVMIGSGKTIVRPVSKIFPLEADDSVEEEKDAALVAEEAEADGSDKGADDQQQKQQSKMQIADVAEKKMGHPMITRAMAKAAIMLVFIFFILFGTMAGAVGGINCNGCEMECKDYGMKVKAVKNMEKVEICCADSCLVQLDKLDSVRFRLSRERTAIEYTCRATYWKGKNVFRDQIDCPAVDMCRRTEGVWERAMNPWCESKNTLLFIGFVMTISSLILAAGLWAICKLFWMFKILFCWPFWVIKSCYKLSRRKQRNKRGMGQDESLLGGNKRDSQRQKRRNRRLFHLGREGKNWMNMALLTTLMVAVSGDAEVLSIQAKSASCFRENGRVECKISNSKSIKLLPANQRVALAIKSDGNELLGELELSMKALLIQCNMQFVRFLRSYEIRVETVKRCPADGSCKGWKCRHVRPNEIVEELEEWNKNPGNSYCLEGKSFWGYECALPGMVCFFHRVFAVPISVNVFELVKCPTWDYVIELRAQLVMGENVSIVEFPLHPGMTREWKDIKFTLMDLIPPIAPVLNDEFVVGESGVALVDGFRSELHCMTNASDFLACELKKEACSECWLDQQEEKVKCACADLSIERMMEDPKKALPLQVNRLQLKNYGKRIVSEADYLPVEILIRMENLTVSAVVSMAKCVIVPISLTGCYACTGAAFKFICRTDFDNLLAEVRCAGGNVFTAHCSENGTTQTVMMSFDHSMIAEFCDAFCPAGLTNFSLVGQLEFIVPEGPRLEVKNGSISIEMRKKDWSGWNPLAVFNGLDFDSLDIGGLFWTLVDWKVIVGLFLSLFLLFFALKIFLLVNPIFRGYRFLFSVIVIFLLSCPLGGAGRQPSVEKDDEGFVESWHGDGNVLALLWATIHSFKILQPSPTKIFFKIMSVAKFRPEARVARRALESAGLLEPKTASIEPVNGVVIGQIDGYEVRAKPEEVEKPDGFRVEVEALEGELRKVVLEKSGQTSVRVKATVRPELHCSAAGPSCKKASIRVSVSKLCMIVVVFGLIGSVGGMPPKRAKLQQPSVDLNNESVVDRLLGPEGEEQNVDVGGSEVGGDSGAQVGEEEGEIGANEVVQATVAGGAQGSSTSQANVDPMATGMEAMMQAAFQRFLATQFTVPPPSTNMPTPPPQLAPIQAVARPVQQRLAVQPQRQEANVPPHGAAAAIVRRCFNCNGDDHFVRDCPRPNRQPNRRQQQPGDRADHGDHERPEAIAGELHGISEDLRVAAGRWAERDQNWPLAIILNGIGITLASLATFVRDGRRPGGL